MKPNKNRLKVIDYGSILKLNKFLRFGFHSETMNAKAHPKKKDGDRMHPGGTLININ